MSDPKWDLATDRGKGVHAHTDRMRTFTLTALMLALVCGLCSRASAAFKPDLVFDGTGVAYTGTNPDGTTNWITEDGDAVSKVSYLDAIGLGFTPIQLKRWYPSAYPQPKKDGPAFVVGGCAKPSDCPADDYAPELKPGEKVVLFPNGAVFVVDAVGYPIHYLTVVKPPVDFSKNPNYNLPYATITGSTCPTGNCK